MWLVDRIYRLFYRPLKDPFTFNYGVIHEWRHTIYDPSVPMEVTLFSTKALVLPLQNPWPLPQMASTSFMDDLYAHSIDLYSLWTILTKQNEREYTTILLYPSHTGTWLKSPVANLASANENAASFMTSPIVCFVSTIFLRISLNLNCNASAFFFNRLWPFWAPLRRPFIAVMAPEKGGFLTTLVKVNQVMTLLHIHPQVLQRIKCLNYVSWFLMIKPELSTLNRKK